MPEDDYIMDRDFGDENETAEHKAAMRHQRIMLRVMGTGISEDEAAAQIDAETEDAMRRPFGESRTEQTQESPLAKAIREGAGMSVFDRIDRKHRKP